jgi:hypothetical protein
MHAIAERDWTVLVYGGREYADREYLFKVLDAIHAAVNIVEIVHGAAMGADSLAESWAKHREVVYRGFPARWSTEFRPAGPKRNKRMLSRGHPEAAVEFPGGKGTANMTELVNEAGIRHIVAEGYFERNPAEASR